MDVCVCVYSVFVLFCMWVAALRRADPPSKEFYRLCKKDYAAEEEARAQRRVVGIDGGKARRKETTGKTKT
jgi:hypothetical protein